MCMYVHAHSRFCSQYRILSNQSLCTPHLFFSFHLYLFAFLLPTFSLSSFLFFMEMISTLLRLKYVPIIHLFLPPKQLFPLITSALILTLSLKEKKISNSNIMNESNLNSPNLKFPSKPFPLSLPHLFYSLFFLFSHLSITSQSIIFLFPHQPRNKSLWRLPKKIYPIFLTEISQPLFIYLFLPNSNIWPIAKYTLLSHFLILSSKTSTFMWLDFFSLILISSEPLYSYFWGWSSTKFSFLTTYT